MEQAGLQPPHGVVLDRHHFPGVGKMVELNKVVDTFALTI